MFFSSWLGQAVIVYQADLSQTELRLEAAPGRSPSCLSLDLLAQGDTVAAAGNRVSLGSNTWFLELSSATSATAPGGPEWPFASSTDEQ